MSTETSKKKNKKQKQKGGKCTYFSLLEGFSLAHILWVRVQANDRTSDEDPQGCQNLQFLTRILGQPELDLGNDSPI